MSVTRYTNAPIPLYDKVINTDKSAMGYLSQAWTEWYDQILNRLGSAAVVAASSGALNAQAASIPATDVTGGQLPAGLYRVSYYAQIAQAATVASSLTVAVDWLRHGVTQTETGAAINGNTTASHQAADFFVRIDDGSPVRYTTTYVSAGATPMLYDFDLLIEELGR